MENIEASKTLDGNGLFNKLGQVENPGDKSLEAATRVYNPGPDFTGSALSSDSSSVDFSNHEIDPQEGIKFFEEKGVQIQEKGVENKSVLSASGEVSENGISLFVEVFGPSDESTKRNETSVVKNIDSEPSFSHAIAHNGSFSSVKVENPGAEVPEKEQESAFDKHNFVVGDLAWVQTKSRSWWPGQIMGPSTALDDAPKPGQKASLWVKYFGSQIFWCSLIQLKPFVENFDLMSSRGKSRAFQRAVEKAVSEFGRRIKVQMTCPCVLREDKASKEESASPRTPKSELHKDLLPQFEPVNFLYLVKKLVLDDSIPGALELASIQNCMSAFYRSLGHLELPMHRLHEESDDKRTAKGGNDLRFKNERRRKYCKARNGNVQAFSEVKSGKAFELRERRRSKYLSYPYIDLNQSPVNAPVLEEYVKNDEEVSKLGQRINNLVDPSSVSPPNVKSAAKKLSRKVSRKATCQPKALVTPGDLTMPSKGLLFKLRFGALNGVLPDDESDFDLVDRFFNVFRRWVFHDKDEADMETRDKSNREFKSQETIGDGCFARDLYPINTLKQRRRKKETSMVSSTSQPCPTSGVVNVNRTSGSFTINFELPDVVWPQNMSAPEKKKKRVKKIPNLPAGEIAVVLPDLNANNIQSPLVEKSQLNSVASSVDGQVLNKGMKKAGLITECSTATTLSGLAEYGPLVKNLQTMDPCSGQSVANELGSYQLSNEGNKLKTGPIGKDPWVTGLFTRGDNKAETKKRKRKEKTSRTRKESNIIPDLNGNGNAGEFSSSGQMNFTTDEGKTLKKRGRRPRSINPPASIESLGTALVLTFTEGFPVPSKEGLIATFCGFGPLNESETRVLSSSSAQIVFKHTSDAVEALKGIEKSSPFGPVLISCRLHHLSPIRRTFGLKPCELKANTKPKEAPGLAYIRKNLETMTSILEKSGNNLSPELRVKLENDIKELLKKVSTMVGSSSST